MLYFHNICREIGQLFGNPKNVSGGGETQVKILVVSPRGKYHQFGIFKGIKSLKINFLLNLLNIKKN